jgi:predicted RNA-binding protein with TRAM domain
LKKFSHYNKSRKRGSSFGGSKALKKTPISVAEEYIVNIEDVNKNGDAGVAKIGGFVIFVNNTKPGDRVTIKITKIADGYATAEVMNKVKMIRNEKSYNNEDNSKSTPLRSIDSNTYPHKDTMDKLI